MGEEKSAGDILEACESNELWNQDQVGPNILRIDGRV